MKQAGIFFIALLCLASSCHKEDKLPTDGHTNIFRCKVNGVEWTPHCISDFFECSAIDCQYYKESKTISLAAKREFQNVSIDQVLKLYKYGINNMEYSLQQTSGREFSDQSKDSPCGYYDLDTLSFNRILIYSIDTIHYIIEGSFEFTVIDYNQTCNDTIKITDGYFNVEYRF